MRACIASPSVIENIRAQISQLHVLSAADARLATLSGMLSIPAVGRTGFNDGLIYPPAEAGGPQLAMRAERAPFERHALAPPTTVQTLNCLVLRVDFSDNIGAQNTAHYQHLLFDAGNPNSMVSFYKDLSYNRLTVTGQVTDWIRADHPYAYYTDGASGTGSNYPHNTPGLLQELLDKYCKKNSLKSFDLNNDGFVDGLFLIHAGGGAEAEPDPNRRKNMIWSHKWTLQQAYSNNGVKAYAYFTAPEDGLLGVFSHEFGHFLGLPDLYDTSYRSYGIGRWCLMAGGSWNGGGNQPARMSAWCLAKLGWITPKVVEADANLSLRALESDSTACCRVWNAGAPPDEYLLIENRQTAGRDTQLPSHGLAIWHIDARQSDNTNPLAYRVALVQADGRRDLEFNRNQGDDSDLFPGSKGVTQVDDASSTFPNLRKNDGTPTGIALTGIAEKGGVVDVSVKFSKLTPATS